MAFHLIDMEKWERREHYHYYRNFIKTRYNLNGDIDITELLSQTKEKRLRFYPVFIFIIMKAVNETKEFRMSLDKDGNLGYWDICHPSYTIFHKDDHTFSDIWTEYSNDFSLFYRNVIQDMENYKDVKGIKTKPHTPPNFCPFPVFHGLVLLDMEVILMRNPICSIPLSFLENTEKKRGGFSCPLLSLSITPLPTDTIPVPFSRKYRKQHLPLFYSNICP